MLGLRSKDRTGRASLMASSFLTPLLRSSAGNLTLRHARSGHVIATRILTAFDSASRRKGLLGRDRLEVGEVLILAPSNAVHTCFMRFALDLAFVARDGRVVKVCTDVPRWRIALAVRAYAVIEAPAGTFARAGLAAGDSVVVAGEG